MRLRHMGLRNMRSIVRSQGADRSVGCGGWGAVYRVKHMGLGGVNRVGHWSRSSVQRSFGCFMNNRPRKYRIVIYGLVL